MLAPGVFANPGTTTDAQDVDGTDVESVGHSDDAGVVTYTVKTFAPAQAERIGELRFDLDLDGDRKVRGADDGCVVMKTVRGTRKLRAGLYKGCRGNAFATADARTRGQLIKLRLLIDELEHAGLDDDAAGYAYRFTAIDRSGTSDTVPDDDDALITHTLDGREAETKNVRRPASAAETPTPSPTATPRSSSSPTPTPSGPSGGGGGSSGRDTTSTGKADETTVEPGDDVDIEGSGFARHKGLQIFLVGGATSTATQSPSPTPSRSPTPSPTASASATPTPPVSFTQSHSSRTTSGDVVVGQRVSGQQVSTQRTAAEPAVMGAAATNRELLGVAISDDDGNVEDDVEIPEDTKAGTYRIVVEGPNPRRGMNTVNIPITVAAQVDNGNDSGDAGNPPTNATGTATQASPTSGTTGGNPTLPRTGSDALQRIFGLGVLTLVLGVALLFARRTAARAPSFAGASSTSAPSAPVGQATRRVLEVPLELRGEMQRLLARRTDRDDPDRDADL